MILDGIKPYDGRYELDIDGQPLTTTEWGWIKRRAGYLPLTLTGEAFADPELIAVLAVIAVRRAGTIEAREVDALMDRIFDAPFGATVTLEPGATDDEGDAGPPPSSSDVRLSTNGASSPNGSESSDSPATPTGVPPSDTSPSAPQMSAT